MRVPSLIGREPAQAVLRTVFTAAVAGRGGMVLVAGEPGIGKTTLAAAFAAEAAAAGALVLRGQCWEGDGAPAYWPWVQVLRAAVTAGGDAGQAARLLPEHATATGGEPGDRFQLFDQMVLCLAGLAAARPVLVVFDDLHRADEPSLRLLEFTARHVTAHPILVLGTYRDEEAGPALRGMAGDHLPLLGLDGAAVAALINAIAAAAPTEQTAAEVCRRTGGNPLLVGELTRLMLARGGWAAPTSPSPVLVDRVRDILERRLARLSAPCADVLTLAAVGGPEVRVEVLAEVVGAEKAGALLDLLDEAASSRVLAPPDAPGAAYRFSHDLFRDTIVAGLPAERRRDLHHAIGRALVARQEQGDPVHPAELAVHFAAAAPTAPGEVVHYSTLAGDEAAARLAFEEAAAHYQRAVAAYDLVGDLDQAKLDLLLRLGDNRNRAGEAPAALAAYQSAAALARSHGDAIGLARVAVATHALGWRISHATAIELLEEAVRALPEAATPLRARTLACLSRDLHHSALESDWDRSATLAERAVAEARALAEPATLAFCLLALHDARWRPGTAEQRLPVVDEMVTAAGAAGEADLVAQGTLLRATALIELGEPAGLNELAAYCRLAERLGHARGRHGAMTRRATLALLTGDLDGARRLADEAVEFGLEIGEPDSKGVYATQCWAAGQVAGTWHLAGPEANPWPRLPLVEAAQAVAAGRPDEAARVLSSLRVDDLGSQRDLELSALVAELVAAAGTAEQRDQLYRRLLPYAGRHVVVGGCASYLGAVDHYLGLLARAAGRTDDAQDHFETAAAQHDQLGAVA